MAWYNGTLLKARDFQGAAAEAAGVLDRTSVYQYVLVVILVCLMRGYMRKTMAFLVMIARIVWRKCPKTMAKCRQDTENLRQQPLLVSRSYPARTSSCLPRRQYSMIR